MTPAASLNPMLVQMMQDPSKVAQIQQLMMVLGGLGPNVPQKPQPQPSLEDPILGGLSGGTQVI